MFCCQPYCYSFNITQGTQLTRVTLFAKFVDASKTTPPCLSWGIPGLWRQLRNPLLITTSVMLTENFDCTPNWMKIWIGNVPQDIYGCIMGSLITAQVDKITGTECPMDCVQTSYTNGERCPPHRVTVELHNN